MDDEAACADEEPADTALEDVDVPAEVEEGAAVLLLPQREELPAPEVPLPDDVEEEEEEEDVWVQPNRAHAAKKPARWKRMARQVGQGNEARQRGRCAVSTRPATPMRGRRLTCSWRRPQNSRLSSSTTTEIKKPRGYLGSTGGVDGT